MKDEFRKILGEELRRHRNKKHLSQPQLAKLAGIHPNSVYQYETGRADISALTLAQICAILEVYPTRILKKPTMKATMKGQSNQHEENSAA